VLRAPARASSSCQASSGAGSFLVAEVRELLHDLLSRQEWLAAIEAPPLRSVGALRPLPVDCGRPGGAGRALDAALEVEAHAAAAASLIRSAAGCA
jgi:hypothetical protein